MQGKLPGFKKNPPIQEGSLSGSDCKLQGAFALVSDVWEEFHTHLSDSLPQTTSQSPSTPTPIARVPISWACHTPGHIRHYLKLKCLIPNLFSQRSRKPIGLQPIIGPRVQPSELSGQQVRMPSPLCSGAELCVLGELSIQQRTLFILCPSVNCGCFSPKVPKYMQHVRKIKDGRGYSPVFSPIFS